MNFEELQKAVTAGYGVFAAYRKSYKNWTSCVRTEKDWIGLCRCAPDKKTKNILAASARHKGFTNLRAKARTLTQKRVADFLPSERKVDNPLFVAVVRKEADAWATERKAGVSTQQLSHGHHQPFFGFLRRLPPGVLDVWKPHLPPNFCEEMMPRENESSTHTSPEQIVACLTKPSLSCRDLGFLSHSQIGQAIGVGLHDFIMHKSDTRLSQALTSLDNRLSCLSEVLALLIGDFPRLDGFLFVRGALWSQTHEARARIASPLVSLVRKHFAAASVRKAMLKWVGCVATRKGTILGTCKKRHPDTMRAFCRDMSSFDPYRARVIETLFFGTMPVFRGKPFNFRHLPEGIYSRETHDTWELDLDIYVLAADGKVDVEKILDTYGISGVQANALLKIMNNEPIRISRESTRAKLYRIIDFMTADLTASGINLADVIQGRQAKDVA